MSLFHLATLNAGARLLLCAMLATLITGLTTQFIVSGNGPSLQSQRMAASVPGAATITTRS